MVERNIKIFIAATAALIILIIVLATQLSTIPTKPDAKHAAKLKKKKPVEMSHVVALVDDNMNYSMNLAKRFPYVAAVTANSTDSVWHFRCFASVILVQWIVTTARCRARLPGHTHRAILYYDYVHNHTHSFPILFWRIHYKYNKTQLLSPRYDIAVAKLNTENYPFLLRPSVIDDSMATEIEASVWKTVATMDRKLYLTNQFDKYNVKISNTGRCFESYGIEIDEAFICVDMSEFNDCFTHDFGPIYSGDKVVGLILIKPVDCDMKLSIFANISYYTDWILETTRDS